MEPRFLDAGEAALVVEFGASVEPAIHDRVLALDAALNASPPEGVAETVPTYRSLMIHYDPLRIERTALIGRVRAILSAPAAVSSAPQQWLVPCCYDPEFGEDLAVLGEKTGLTPARVAEIHAGATYRVYMYGFAPGFCYLGGLPLELSVSRRETPRPPHPANTVMIGGGLALITTFSMPTGWWLVGRTPERMFAPAREPQFLIPVGDTLRFDPVDRATFAALDARAAAGEIVAMRQPS